MRTGKRKALSLILTLCMVFGMITMMPEITVYAATEIASVDATCTDPLAQPVYGETVEQPSAHIFTIINANPAEAMGSLEIPTNMWHWEKKVGTEWETVYSGETFGAGTYRCRAQLREESPAYVLANTTVLTVDGTAWSKDSGDVDVSGDISFHNWLSGEYTVTKPSGALEFADSSSYDLLDMSLGTAITPIDVSEGVSGGTSPYTYSATDLPDGITINGSTGEISGTPTQVSDICVAYITVTDHAGAKATISIYCKVIFNGTVQEVASVDATCSAPPAQPVYGATVEDDSSAHVFTITNADPLGAKAFLRIPDSMWRWEKKVGTEWVTVNSGETFGAGTYRFRVQLREDTPAYVLANTTVLKVDGTAWSKAPGEVYVSGDTSFHNWVSGEYTVTEATYSGVSVTPATATVQRGDTQTFTAAVSGTGSYDPSVTWSVSGGTSSSTAIDASGVLTVGSDETATTLTVTATSVGDNNKRGTADVIVTSGAHTHSLTHHAAVAATCTTAGNIEYWECSVCHRKFRDEAGSTEVADADLLLPATGHHYETAWTSNEEGHYHVCADCGEKSDFANHVFGAWVHTGSHTHECGVCGYKETELCTFGDWTVTKQPTATEKGEKQRTCLKCGYVEKAEIPATGTPTNPDGGNTSKPDSGSPQTGDSSHAALWIVLMLAAAGSAFGVSRKRKETDQ